MFCKRSINDNLFTLRKKVCKLQLEGYGGLIINNELWTSLSKHSFYSTYHDIPLVKVFIMLMNLRYKFQSLIMNKVLIS